MKIRNGFVSNSSSSSFCIYGANLETGCPNEVLRRIDNEADQKKVLDEFNKWRKDDPYKTWEELVLENVDIVIASDKYLISITNDSGAQTDVQKLTCIDCNIELKGNPIFYVGNDTSDPRSVAEVEMTGGMITAENDRFIELRNGHCRNGANFTGVAFNKGAEWFAARYADQTVDIILNNCEFTTSLAYIIVCRGDGSVITYTADGCTYIDPTGHLFWKDAGVAESLSINLTNSSGTVTAAKVRNNADIVVIACDLPYV